MLKKVLETITRDLYWSTLYVSPQDDLLENDNTLEKFSQNSKICGLNFNLH
jgi:hypothetical protein